MSEYDLKLCVGADPVFAMIKSWHGLPDPTNATRSIHTRHASRCRSCTQVNGAPDSSACTDTHDPNVHWRLAGFPLGLETRRAVGIDSLSTAEVEAQELQLKNRR